VLAVARRTQILEMLRQERTIRSEHAAQVLGVSVETIRRDLEQLDHAGELVRVYGGAIPVDMAPASEPPFEARNSLAADSKKAIGRTAAELANQVRTLFLDIGTTAMQVAAALSVSTPMTVVTPSMRVAEILTTKPTITAVVPGGVVRGGDLAISGGQAVEFMRDVSPDLALLGSGGVSVERGLTDFEMDEVSLKRVALKNSSRTYVLADSSKIGSVAPYRVCDLAVLTGIITDGGIVTAHRESLESAGLDVLVGDGVRN
jgi:DeoR/GlpR family transcriptional regulator of sugar metabolism